ncbi:conserved hypothetical protein [Talaromyces stipitatus ATCC 10500]|uniref:Hydantoinase/oxoprolinase n=1 Tax=Talaromyces stipitatus (strain ATCC 10500 / CBS 375.48 / QM 6759 / NRRL 1006) TaxID=441959 RepID=B8MH12_TALSN|nr:uncharacterized protein TSTA_018920 [Talaromyces stipitatus ATCC 10500]EED16826.1 conserved hypothetical protein [Talaromyces stipitatus ATCC 10500]
MRTLVGIDVGGTNTDAVLIDADTAPSDPTGSILASCKTPTTRHVGDGISQALQNVLEQWTGEERRRIVDSLVRITIGTTQFLNAVVERDSQKLSPVALLRLCGPYTRELPGFAGIPPELRRIIEGTTVYLSGGLEYNGNLIEPLDEAEIRRTAAELRSRQLLNVAIVGVHTSIDFTFQQEETVEHILREELGPSAIITLSRDIAGLGLLERENATVINAALRPLAKVTVSNLTQSLTALGIRAPAFFTQNNGALISASEAKCLPILTYLSGPINSLTGAAFLSRGQGPFLKDVVVVDVGGTKTDTCVLQPTGLPRPAAAFSLLSGARTNFSVPDLRSIGLGGGSIIHVDEKTGNVRLGPDSVGYQLETRSRIFGGPDLTVTDVVVSAQRQSPILLKSTAKSIEVAPDVLRKVEKEITRLLETVVDESKTEGGPVNIILVGGGTFLVSSSIPGVGRIYRPNYGHVANAVGAAMARMSHKIDQIVSIGLETTEEKVLSRQCDRTIEEARLRGALNPQIVEKRTMPLSYSSTRKVRIITTAVGDAALSPSTEDNEDNETESPVALSRAPIPSEDQAITTENEPEPTKNASTYRPSVVSGRWKLSQADLYFLFEGCGILGCGILGCGGGGDPYPSFLSSLALLKAGQSVYVVDPGTIPANGAVPAVGFMGSLDILSERFPSGEELKYSVQSVTPQGMDSISGVISLEIGGSNGFRGIQAAAWTQIPVIDADLMGRAYPNLWQTTLTRAGIPITPCAVSDAKGNTLIHHRAASHQAVENFLRPLCAEMGNAAGTSFALLNGDQIRSSTVHHSLSLAWRVGRAVYIARQEKTGVVASILAEYPGRLIFTGKIVQVKRDISGGFSRGFIDLVRSHAIEKDDEPVRVEFQNENLRVTTLQGKKTLTVVPDLITVLDSETGSAVGTQDYRYGLHVFVIALVASPQWSEQEGLKIGGPAAFG